MRSDSVQSVQSVESNCSSLVCEHCRCDDCILGITDHHVAIADLTADLEGKMRLQSQFLSSVARVGAASAADASGLGIGGGDRRGEVGDNGNFRRKVRGQMNSTIYTALSIKFPKNKSMAAASRNSGC